MIIREAMPEDAEEACAVLRRSITELCEAVSKAILGRLEEKVRELGVTTCRLKNSRTAHRFYLSAGYEDDLCLEKEGGTTRGILMAKRL